MRADPQLIMVGERSAPALAAAAGLARASARCATAASARFDAGAGRRAGAARPAHGRGGAADGALPAAATHGQRAVSAPARAAPLALARAAGRWRRRCCVLRRRRRQHRLGAAVGAATTRRPGRSCGTSACRARWAPGWPARCSGWPARWRRACSAIRWPIPTCWAAPPARRSAWRVLLVLFGASPVARRGWVARAGPDRRRLRRRGGGGAASRWRWRAACSTRCACCWPA